MKVTKVEIVRSQEPIPLPAPWRAAWREPILTDKDGCVKIPDKPGIGVELSESFAL